MLAPAAVVRSVLAGRAPFGHRLTSAELRAMRGLSALYAFGAMTFLFLLFHRLKPGALQNLLLPVALLLGTSLPRWAFARSIFSHPAELFLLCVALWLAALPTHGRTETVRALAQAFALGLLTLVRGEYALSAPLLLFIARPTEGSQSPRSHRIALCVAQLFILAAFDVLLRHWLHSVSTGYGSLSSTELPASAGVLSVAARITENAGILLSDFFLHGGLIFLAFGATVASTLHRPTKSTSHSLPFRPCVFAGSVALLFLLNCAFSPPLGLEVGHRYALKLYPFALIALWSLFSLQKVHGLARSGLIMLTACAVAVNFVRMSDPAVVGGAWQNFTVLTNLQLIALPPSGSETTNMQTAFAVLSLCLVAKYIRRPRRSA